MEIFSHSPRRAFVRSNTDVGWEGLAQNLRFIQKKCSIRFWLGAYGGQSNPFKPNSLICVFLDNVPLPSVRKELKEGEHPWTVPTKHSQSAVSSFTFFYPLSLSGVSCHISFSCHSRTSVWISDTAQKSQYIPAAVCFLLLISWERSGLRTKRLSSACWWR